MTRCEVIGAFESSFHPPPATLCELIYDTGGDGVLKAFNSQRPAIGPYRVAQIINRGTTTFRPQNAEKSTPRHLTEAEKFENRSLGPTILFNSVSNR
jgi:hypothetical protein